MRIWNLKFARLAAAMICLAGVTSVSFYLGAKFGRTYERYRFVYEASKREGIRAALWKLVGRDKSYAQFAQDRWVAHGIAPGKRNGFYVDVGSADGELASNTKLLDDMGWKGICIDPFPTNMGQRTCQVFRQPVFSESGKKVKFRAAGGLGGIESDLNRHKDIASPSPLVEFVTATLDEILAQGHAPKYIDFMSMDVEGAEYDALRGLSLDQYEIGSLVIEHNYEMEKREAIRKLLVGKGYVRVRSWEVDDWYVHRSLAPKFDTFLSYCSNVTNCPY